MRLAQLIYERKRLPTLRSALERLFDSLRKYLGRDKDLEVQRSLVVYNSKPLINVFLQHRAVLEEVYSHDFLFSHRLKAFTFKHGLKEMFGKLFMVAEGDEGAKLQLFPNNFSTLCYLARQSQGCDKNEELHQGAESCIESSLTLPEFMLLLVNIAVHQSKFSPVKAPPLDEVASPESGKSQEKKLESPILREEDQAQPSILPLTFSHLLDSLDFDYSDIALRVQQIISHLSSAFLSKTKEI